MMFENLTDDNVELYAAKMYEKPNAVMSEFHEDFSRFLYMKRTADQVLQHRHTERSV